MVESGLVVVPCGGDVLVPWASSVPLDSIFMIIHGNDLELLPCILSYREMRRSYCRLQSARPGDSLSEAQGRT